jgi:hypothetical protein
MVSVPLIIPSLQDHVKGYNRCEPFTAKLCWNSLKSLPAVAGDMAARRVSERRSVFKRSAPHVRTHVSVDVRTGIDLKS